MARTRPAVALSRRPASSFRLICAFLAVTAVYLAIDHPPVHETPNTVFGANLSLTTIGLE